MIAVAKALVFSFQMMDLKKKLTFGYHKTMSYIHGSLGVEVQVTMNIFVSKNYTYDSKV
jgi:hypothetical protein